MTLTLSSVDVPEAKERLAATDEVLLGLLSRLVVAFAQEVALLVPSVLAEETELLRSRLHKLKGAAGNVSAKELYRAIERAEPLVRARLDGFEEARPELVEECLRDVREEFFRMKSEIEAQSHTEPSYVLEVNEDEVALRRALETRAFDALELLPAARAALLSKLPETQWAEFQAAVENLRFAEALRLLDAGKH